MIGELIFATTLVAPAKPMLRAGLALAVAFVLLALMVVAAVARGLRWLRRSWSSLYLWRAGSERLPADLAPLSSEGRVGVTAHRELAQALFVASRSSASLHVPSATSNRGGSLWQSGSNLSCLSCRGSRSPHSRYRPCRRKPQRRLRRRLPPRLCPSTRA